MLSAAGRPLTLRKRPDLRIEPQQYGQERYWLVKDPVSLAYFHLCEEEHAVLEMLDGRASLAQVKRGFEKLFAPLQVTYEQLQAFLGRLHRAGLLLSDAPGQGEQLLERRARVRRRAWLGSLANVLALRFPGLDPDPLLGWLYGRLRWLFSGWFLALCLMMIGAAGVLAAVQFHTIGARLPDFRAFFTTSNALWLAGTLAAVKVLHEFGHALTCKHFGGECHELGLLLLVFTPCLYCDVSDAWTLMSKWQRIAVSAAGVVVEVLLASVAVFLWWASVPGVFHTLCLNVVLVCSVSTLLFNGNPLLRYDGYYILADLIDVPNLGQQSRALLGRGLVRGFLGVRLPPDRSLPVRRRGFLAAYGLASVVYRWFVVICILWFCYRLAKEYGLEVLAQALVLAVVVGMLIAPIAAGVRLLRSPAVRRGMRWGRTLWTAAVLIAVVYVIAAWPFPFSVTAPAVIEPRDARPVYVVVAGRLESVLPPATIGSGRQVAKGQEIARLSNFELTKEIVALRIQRDQQRLRLKDLRAQRGDDPGIPAAQSALDDVEERLRQRLRDEEGLVLRAPIAGRVLPAPRQGPQTPGAGQLGAWQGTPSDERNRGCYLEIGTPLCLVAPDGPWEAAIVIDQSQISFVRTGQRVRLQLDEVPCGVLHGTVSEVAKVDLKSVPRELIHGGDLPLRVDENGVPRPLTACYQARVALDEQDVELLIGTRGRAKILANPQSLAWRAWRAIQATFQLQP
jgi:putative peptide zinc metalloprotease protein